MALTATEQRLVDWAKAQLPNWFSHGEREEEYLGALAKMHGIGLVLAQNWLGQTLILQAVGPAGGDADWLNFHAEERDTKRQESELDPELRLRIRSVEDAVTPPILLAAAQAIIDSAGIGGTVYIVEVRRDGAHFGTYTADTAADGGTFADQGGGVFSFTPVTPFARAVLGHPESTHWQNPQLVISGALTPANDGTFPVTGLLGDGVLFTNGSGVAEVDSGANWVLQKRDVEGNLRDGRRRAYFSRGYRFQGTPRNALVFILPFGCTPAISASVVEMLRQKAGAGVQKYVECRAIP